MKEDTPPVEWVKFYPEKWMAGTQGLSAPEIGVYISICAFNMSSGKSVTLRTLERRFRDEDVAAIVEELRLDGKVQVKDEAIWNDKAIATYTEAANYRMEMRERCQKGVEARKKKAAGKPSGKPPGDDKSTTRSTHTDRQTDRQSNKHTGRKEPSKLGAGEKYHFEGQTIRLTKADYDAWETAYPQIDLRRELTGIDNWIIKNNVKGAWFARVSAMLRKANEEAVAQQDGELDDAIGLAEGVE